LSFIDHPVEAVVQYTEARCHEPEWQASLLRTPVDAEEASASQKRALAIKPGFAINGCNRESADPRIRGPLEQLQIEMRMFIDI
jgi:hypothetical protein